jgi:FAD/FMN-containing dehydrogenase
MFIKESGGYKMIENSKLAKIVGAGNVLQKPEVLESYSKDMSFVHPVKPSCIVKVKNAEEIQSLVKLAQETQTPLIPISSGAPHFRGDTVPSAGGAIMVDLSGMKKIMRVDRYNRDVLIEPGVTFGELIPAVEKAGIRLNLPLAPRSTKSVVGSMLEREPVIMPKYHWDISDPLATVEVIFGTGALFRTGAAAGPGTLEEQWEAGGAQKEAAGPSTMSFHRILQGSQGTMGIVTWASARCELLPEYENAFMIGSNQLEKIKEAVHWLIRLRLADICLVLNNSDAAELMAENAAEYKKIKDSLPAWVLLYTISAYEYLPEERVKGQILDTKDVLQRIGVEAAVELGCISAAKLLETVRKPSKDPYWKIRRRGGCEDISFITIYDKLNGIIKAMNEAAVAAGYPVSDMGIYLQPIVQGVNCHCEFNLFYDPSDLRESQRVKELSASVVKTLVANGAFFSRPYGGVANEVLNNDAATVAAFKKMKAIVDPNNILNPGKLCF